MKVGRPSEYKPEYCQMADEYLATCGREQTKLPKITEFYRYIGVSDQCAEEWQEKYPEFGGACKKIMNMQKEELIDDGLYGGKEVNASMAIFLLKANHGMIETEKKQIVGADGEAFRIIIGDGVQGHQPLRPDKDPSGTT